LSDFLRLTGVKPGESGSVAIDDYVRFSFESPAGTAGTGTVAIEDAPGGLVEIAIDIATGRLRGAALVSFARKAKVVEDDFTGSLPSEDGLPTFAVDGFAGDGAPLPRIAERGPIDLLRAEGLGVVQLAAGTPDRMVRTGSALFLFVGDSLWGFGADGLSREDWSRMTG
jgi:hypothetical protein